MADTLWTPSLNLKITCPDAHSQVFDYVQYRLIVKTPMLSTFMHTTATMETGVL